MASPEELLEQIRQKSQQPNDLGFTGGQLGMGAGQGVLPETTNPFAVQTGVTPQAPVVGPTIANEQPAIPRMTPELAAQREEARGPMEDSSFLGNIGSVFSAPQESVVPRGGVRTRGTGGSVSPEAEARTGGIAGADELLGFTKAVQGIVNPSEEQKAANLAAGRTGGIQALPEPQVAAPQVEMSTPESIASLSVNGTDVVTPEALTEAGKVPQAAAPQLDAPQQAGDFGLAGFTPQFEGQTPSQFMRGEDTPESTTFQGTDFQGRLRQFDSPEAQQANIAEGQASFAQASADREARQAARPDFGTAISDRDRRAASGEDISTADRRDMAKANMRGASASDIARGNKIADELGVDLKTGKPLTTGTTAKDIAETDKIKAETLSILSEIGNKGTELNLSPAELARDKAAGGTLNKWNDSGRATIQSNINTLNEVITGLEDGNIKTRGFIDALPFGADWARAIINPTGADAKDRVQGVIFQTLKETLGAQFTEKEGKRLVEASYNSMLSPEANAARLRDYTTGLKKAAEARESQMRYLQENKTLAGYQGPSPKGIMSQVGSGGASGSPIKGDVDDKSLDGALL